MSEMPIDDESVMGRMIRSMGPFGFLAVDVRKVNLDDLLTQRPGAIVRMNGRPGDCIKFFVSPEAITLGCVAGWISDGD